MRGNFGGGGYGGPDPGYGNSGGQNPRLLGTVGNQSQYTEDFFVYSQNIGAIASLAVSNQSFQIQADSDFEWMMSTASGNLHGNAEPWADSVIIPITMSITDSGSGRQLTSSPVPIMGMAGTGKQPFILPVPRRFMAKSTVSMVFTSYDATTAWDNLFFNFIGRKIFWLG